MSDNEKQAATVDRIIGRNLDTTTDREKLIEEAAIAIHEIAEGGELPWFDAHMADKDQHRAEARAALAVFEKAHAQERESIAFHPHPEDLKCTLIDPHADPVVMQGNRFDRKQWRIREVDLGFHVYQDGGEFVGGYGGVWVPGVYETFEEAVEAVREIGKVRPPIE